MSNFGAQCWNVDDVDGYLKLYRDDAVLHGYAGVEPGIESIRSFYRAFFGAFPASKLELQDVMAAGDRVACRFMVSGMHRGPFQGMPATNKPFSLPGITILRFADGRCVERWSQADCPCFSSLGRCPPEGCRSRSREFGRTKRLPTRCGVRPPFGP